VGSDPHYRRPETVESLFIAYRLTGDEIYREYGWRVFQAIEKHAKVPSGGYATVLNVDENPARLEDKMETFFLVSAFSISSKIRRKLTRKLVRCRARP
jgi:mannosyl-oligosaccharide alpha-1,2-mannosidase